MTTAPRACVIGHPIAHSRSPMIHGHWLATQGLPGHYGKEDVHPDDLVAFIRGLAARGYVGCNVTVPHKEHVMAALDVVEDAARAIGAVNTIWIGDDRRLHGTNTDVPGFLASMDADQPGWDRHDGPAIVLGAGGAAHAVVYALLSRGFERITIINRTASHAAELASRFGPKVTAQGWDHVFDGLSTASLLVNATSLGMQGQPPLTLDLGLLRPGAVVADLVYVPLETQLLAEARRRGHPVVEGLGMLLHQAAPGFARWFGVMPPVTAELRALIEADIRAKTAGAPAKV